MTGWSGSAPDEADPGQPDRPAGRRGSRSRTGRSRRRAGSFPDPEDPAVADPDSGSLPGGAPDSTADDGGNPESVARAICLRALTGAAKTRAQLAELLERRGVPEEAADAVLDRFGEVGLIDDAAFARAWVSSRQSGRGLARRALRAELRAKGVDGEDAEQALAQVDDEDERATARDLVERRLRSMSRLDRVTATRRLVGMLARKGYNGGLAGAVVREVLDRAGSDDDVPGWGDEVR